MYDIKWIRENAATFDEGLSRRGMPETERTSLLRRLLDLDHQRRTLLLDLETARQKQNQISKEIGRAAKTGGADAALVGMRELLILAKAKIQGLDRQQTQVETELKKELAQIPNTPLPEPDVPTGSDERSNRVEHTFGEIQDSQFKVKQHFELGEALGMMDFELAAKLSGARFVVLQNGLARLERAIGQFFLDFHTGPIRNDDGAEVGGYTEVNPPLMVTSDTMFGTAQLPKFADDQFPTYRRRNWGDVAETLCRKYQDQGGQADISLVKKIIQQFLEEGISSGDPLFVAKGAPQASELIDFVWTNMHAAWKELDTQSVDLWLIPTAEVPLTNLVRESIVAEDALPMRLTACTPCFRAEAGAAGKDTRGMIRQHQFTKVELVSITTPDKSRDEHERMLSCAEAVLKKLDLHYRVMTLCTGDMGFASQKTYDIEVWLPGQNMYREISSCSVCGDFQARRMNARFRAKDGKPQFVHTLNGSGVAVGRALIAVMENYQQDNGAIAVPDVLQPYMGGVKVIERAQ